ncbi:MAG: hsp70 family protein [Syntrophobacterales bacterium]|nr:hsp70 family protein [Syntrophobacterales bacterium]
MKHLRHELRDYNYIIGIDLGTTNSAVAYVDLAEDIKDIRVFEIPQYVALGEVLPRPVLPSFLYLPGKYDLPRDYLGRLPWEGQREGNIEIVGEFAREQGASVPHRLVASAKSWLCHGRVNRRANILPWGVKESDDLKKVSPVEASARYLSHVRNAWNFFMAKGDPERAFEQQFIVLTVPASFDEVARELTVEASRLAGIPKLVLIEEPLAAFYAWLSLHERDWSNIISPGQIVLICDVGGGTTDLTIVALKRSSGVERELHFDRLAVGEHLLLGGDNMDIAIARYVEEKITGKIGSLDPRRWHQLCYQARRVKEQVLSDSSVAEAKFTVLGHGTKLIGETLSTRVEADEIRRLILDGFFPFVGKNERPSLVSRTGIVEWGLPYVQDPAITKHIAWFWNRFEKLVTREIGREDPRPDFVLFNGGALTPLSIRRRVLDVISDWFGERPQEIAHPRLDLAVGIGAAYYALVRFGQGVRVGAGSPRSYYVVVGRKEEAVGESHRGKYDAVCIVPRGTEEGFEHRIEERSFEVISNQPVSFRLLASTTRVEDKLGDLVTLSEEDSLLLPPINTVLRFGKTGEKRAIPVTLGVKLTEVGTLELWCQSLKTPHKWQLQFDVRETSESEREAKVREHSLVEETIEVETIEKALELISATFDRREIDPPDLPKLIEETFEVARERWPLGVVRKIADKLLEYEKARSISFHHEARWFNLLGFCLRPGFGDVLDEWRMKEVWKIFPQDLIFSRQIQCRLEWWIFWRRVAGGLTSGQQWRIYQQVSSFIQEVGYKKKRSRTLSPQEIIELWMCLASMEHLPVETKISLGRSFLSKIIKAGKPSTKELWVIGRLGARSLLYGPVDKVVPPEEVVGWVNKLLEKGFSMNEAFGYTLLSMVRETGDRARDVPPEVRERTLRAIERVLPESKVRSFIERTGSPEGRKDKEWAFGETLPPGIILSDL